MFRQCQFEKLDYEITQIVIKSSNSKIVDPSRTDQQLDQNFNWIG